MQHGVPALGIIADPHINPKFHMKKISTNSASTSRSNVAEEDTSPRPNNRTKDLNEVSKSAPRADQALRNALPRRQSQEPTEKEQDAAAGLLALHQFTTKG
ncbi:hypothetical protein ACYT85_23290 [Ralstonia solanacearum]|uniref:hypothetical protein n=2 Tax=Ralstonia solanacearum TaxID=305 RepID=UPI000A544827|nr:hypothetical protein [Ralstonia solanacearum]MDB0553304.1 hypothetical protein [Ralstonia solanacearum]